ncbi:deaminase domain-containing protein [Chitinophaga sp. LS1]|uniref:deaminase domain-containing protein n=1 Tax=Chitinophaga sp. LS1 TaxID=3051176 RepID=UPI002AAAF882|nr:deaminase domain-containing protein [Chitinophaga sp. LS1]WPV63913.1 deaminase domain-containing protein [Chitinophaga sp. LS1]
MGLDQYYRNRQRRSPTNTPIPKNRFFKTFEVRSKLRETDSEVKILEKIAETFQSNIQVNESLKITSKRPYCVSCEEVIQQFQGMFKNVKLEFVNGIKPQNMNVYELKTFLEQKGDVLTGCSSFQVRSLERYFKIKLPMVYKDFLYAMGIDAGRFMKGSDAFYRHLYNLKDGFLSELFYTDLELLENSFVFWTHQGYQYAFFLLDAGDNPPVYYYLEGETEFKKIESLSAFWEREMPDN